MAKNFLPYNLDQQLLLPPNLRDWLPEGHLALFVSDVVDQLDLSSIFDSYAGRDSRGRAGYHPVMMVKLLIYAYAVGMPSSRKIEKATSENVAFRILSGDQHPDHDSIASFRKTHLNALAGLFFQVLHLCQKAGLVKLGHISIDGSKFQANASKHKAMSYGRMSEAEKRIEAEVKSLLSEAERIDAQEDGKYGKGRRGDELPKEMQRRESRLRKIREAKTSLEAEAKAAAEAKTVEVKKRLAERAQQEAETGKKSAGRPPSMPDPEQAKPDDKAQRNFTDPESRIMPDGAHKGSFIQAYNAQIAVDGEAQIIVATTVTQETNDKRQLLPMAQKVIENVGRLADVTSADAGYFSEQAVTHEALTSTELLVPPNRKKHDETQQQKEPSTETTTSEDTPDERMRKKLQSETGHDLYKMRKAIVEPVFGQIKEVRGFRRFSLRGLDQVSAEFDIVALAHNLLKLFRHGLSPLPALCQG